MPKTALASTFDESQYLIGLNVKRKELKRKRYVGAALKRKHACMVIADSKAAKYSNIITTTPVLGLCNFPSSGTRSTFKYV